MGNPPFVAPGRSKAGIDGYSVHPMEVGIDSDEVRHRRAELGVLAFQTVQGVAQVTRVKVFQSDYGADT
jgi:hypothetical protein